MKKTTAIQKFLQKYFLRRIWLHKYFLRRIPLKEIMKGLKNAFDLLSTIRKKRENDDRNTQDCCTFESSWKRPTLESSEIGTSMSIAFSSIMRMRSGLIKVRAWVSLSLSSTSLSLSGSSQPPLNDALLNVYLTNALEALNSLPKQLKNDSNFKKYALKGIALIRSNLRW